MNLSLDPHDMEYWYPQTIDLVDASRRISRQLIESTDEVFPVDLPSSGMHDEWPLVGWAMLARACRTLDSITALAPERAASDASVLTRTLFEEAVTFAWIAIDPDENVKSWLRWDRSQRIKMDNDLVDRGAEHVLESDVRAQFERFIDEGPVMPDNLTQRADEVDNYWTTKIEALDPSLPFNFRAMYRYIYRFESFYAHAAVAPLLHFVDYVESENRAIMRLLEQDPGLPNTFTRAPMLYGFVMLVASVALDLPSFPQKVEEAFSKYMPATLPDV